MIRSTPATLVVLLVAAQVCAGQAPSPSPTPTPSPSIKVVDADASGLIKLTVSETNSSFRIPLEIEGADISNFFITVDDFVSVNGTRVHPRVTLDGNSAAGPFNIALNERPVLEVTASFPIAGEYKSHLVASYSGKLKNWTLTVERKKEALTVQIDAVETVAVTKGCYGNASVRFTVRETAGQKVNLYPPALEGVALKESDKVRKQARFAQIKLDGQPLASGAPQSQVESYTVEALSGRTSVFEIEGIEDPGEYIGTIRLSGSNGNPVTKELTMLVKNDWYVAAFWISVGVLASFSVRKYTKELRPKLAGLRRLDYVRDDFAAIEKAAGAPGEPIKAVFVELQKQLDRIQRSLDQGTAVNNAADPLTEIETKIQALPEWLNAGRRLDAVSPPALVEATLAEWETLGRSYFAKAGTPADIIPLLAKIEEGLRTAVIDAIEAFSKEVLDYAKNHPDMSAEIDQKVMPGISEAKKNANPATWRVMSDQFRTARTAFAKVLRVEFDRALKGPAPLGLAEDRWRDLANQLKPKISALGDEDDVRNADERYNEINGIYFAALIQALRSYNDTLPAEAAEGTDGKTVQTALQTAEDARLRNDWRTVRIQYDAAVIATRKRVAAAGGGGLGEIGPSTRTGVLEALSSTAFAPVEQLRGIKTHERIGSEKLTEKIDQYDLLLTAAIMLITCVVGVGLLWLNDPIWGGWRSYITAMLWGLGLHQVAGSSLDGLPALVKKFSE